MTRRIATGLVAAALNTSLTLAEENHKAEATLHAQAAAVGEHAAMAKTHAEAAEKEKRNPHLEAGIDNLNNAIEHAKMGHADIAGQAAGAAAGHLKAAEKAF
jgi:hypothetical protein